MVQPTKKAAGLAAALGLACVLWPFGWTSQVWIPLVVLNLGLLVAVVVDGRRAPSPRNLEIERKHAPTLERGGRAAMAWSVRNPTRSGARVALSDAVPPSLRPADTGFEATVGAGQVATASTTLAPVRRGLVGFGDISVRSTGPWGLGFRQADITASGSVRVLPYFRSRAEAEVRIIKARVLEIGTRSVKLIGAGTDFETLRDYSPDDDFRHIDWRASARSGRPIVRTFRTERNQNLVILLDNGRVMAGNVDGAPRVEHAMDAALMVGTVSTRLGDKCALMTFDSQVQTMVPSNRDRSQPARFAEAMFDLEPSLSESDYEAALSAAVARFRRRSLYVILTDLAEQSINDNLVPAMPVIAQTHIVVVGAVTDPVVAAWATRTPTSGEEAYERAAAIEALASRRRAAERLQGTGAIVIDAPAAELPGKLVDAYLSIKARGRL